MRYGYGYSCDCGCGSSFAIDPLQAAASITIADDDDWTVSLVSSGIVPVEDFGQPGVLTVSRSGGSDSSFPVVVEFAMSGSAQQNVDYYLQDESGNWLGSWVEIPAYATSVDIRLQPINDAETEQGEWVEMSLTRAAAFSGGCSIGYEFGQSHSGSIVIEDGDDWWVWLNPTHDVLPEGGGSATTFQLSRGNAWDLSYGLVVNFSTSGTAQQGVDYVLRDAAGGLLGTSVEIPAHAWTATFTLQPANDALAEDDEDVTLTLTSVYAGCGCGCGVGGPYSIDPGGGAATVTLVDDDSWTIVVSEIREQVWISRRTRQTMWLTAY